MSQLSLRHGPGGKDEETERLMMNQSEEDKTLLE